MEWKKYNDILGFDLDKQVKENAKQFFNFPKKSRESSGITEWPHSFRPKFV